MRDLKLIVVLKRLTNSYFVVKCPSCINKIKCLVCSGVHSGGVRPQVLAFAHNSVVLYHQGPSSGTVGRICAFRGWFLSDVRTTGRHLSFISNVVSFYCNAACQHRAFLLSSIVELWFLHETWELFVSRLVVVLFLGTVNKTDLHCFPFIFLLFHGVWGRFEAFSAS